MQMHYSEHVSPLRLWRSKLNTSNLLNVAFTHLQAGRPEKATAICQSILREQPNDTDTLNFLGVVAHQSGEHTTAIDLLEKAIRIRQDVPEYYNNCGEAYRAMRQYELAVDRYVQAITIKRDYAEAYNNLGNAHQEQGQLTRAIDSYHEALEIRPDYPEAHNNLAAALQEQGRIEDAIAHYEKALALKPDYANARRHLAMLNPDPEQAPVIEKLLTNPAISEEEATHLYFALGRIYDANEIFDDAFENYRQGNTLKRKTLTFDVVAHASYVDSLIKTYSAKYFDEKFEYGVDSTVPVFIVGMPRSGTTLVEQIISCHPDVHGAGELIFAANCERMVALHDSTLPAYPDRMQQINRSKVHVLAEHYLETLCMLSPDASRIVDKMPDNFLRLGLIKTLFPNARVIHCKRNSLDTCLSIYFHYFQTANDFAFELDEIAQYYLKYDRLMQHWRSLRLPGFFEIQYEELLMNQETMSRKLIDHLGLKWNDRCLEFYKNERPVKTSSVLQVRQPMYTESIDKWRKYKNHLGPLISILQQSR